MSFKFGVALKNNIDMFTKDNTDLDDLLIKCITRDNKRSPQLYPFFKDVYKINFIFTPPPLYFL